MRRAAKVDGVQPPDQPSVTPPPTPIPPAAGPPGGGVVPGPPVGKPPGRPRNRRLRLFVAMGAGILALLCLGGVGVAISLYDEATEIKRTSPDAVADSFLRAYLVNRDEDEVSLYRCESGGDFAQLEEFRRNIEATERQYTLGIRVTWTSLVVETTNGRTTVSTDLVRTLEDNSERDAQRWRLLMVDQGGWRVCGATRLS